MTSLIFCGEWGTIVLYGPSYGHAKTNQSLYPLFHIDVNIQGNRLENSVSPMLMALGTSYMDVRKMTVSKPSGKNRANIPLLLNCAAFVSQGCIAAVAKIRMAKKSCIRLSKSVTIICGGVLSLEKNNALSDKLCEYLPPFSGDSTIIRLRLFFHSYQSSILLPSLS